MNLNKYAEAIIRKEQQLKALEDKALKPLKEQIRELREHLLGHLKEEGIKTIDTKAARLQVRSRKVNFVEEEEIARFTEAGEGEWDVEVDDIWPATYDKVAALKFAQDYAPDLIKSNTSQSLVVNPKGGQ